MLGSFRLRMPISPHIKQHLRWLASASNNASAAAVTDANAAGAAAAFSVQGSGSSCNSSNPSCSQELVRHGPGDGVIKLNVGGKEFLTLRSTVQSNAVLADYVARAEANSEYNGTAIFIDRDPTHFGMILTFLRNKMEGIAYNSKFYPAPPAVKVAKTTVAAVAVAPAAVATTSDGTTSLHTNKTNCHTLIAVKLNKKPKYVRLPTDQGILQDLYVEACHYQMYDLQSQLCEATLITTIISYFGGGGNPYQQASELFQRIRNWVAAVALVGTTTTTGGAILTLPDDWKSKIFGGGSWFRKSNPTIEPQPQ